LAAVGTRRRPPQVFHAASKKDRMAPRFVQGAQHAIAMQFDFAAERLGESLKRLVGTLRGVLLI
jgi:hypothetical protein